MKAKSVSKGKLVVFSGEPLLVLSMVFDFLSRLKHKTRSQGTLKAESLDHRNFTSQERLKAERDAEVIRSCTSLINRLLFGVRLWFLSRVLQPKGSTKHGALKTKIDPKAIRFWSSLLNRLLFGVTLPLIKSTWLCLTCIIKGL